MENKLYRNANDSVFSGVCSGIAEYYKADVSLIRIVFLLLLFSSIPIDIIYIIMALVVPEKPEPPL